MLSATSRKHCSIGEPAAMAMPSSSIASGNASSIALLRLRSLRDSAQDGAIQPHAAQQAAAPANAGGSKPMPAAATPAFEALADDGATTSRRAGAA